MAGGLTAGSVSFDRAADTYDATRALSEHVQAKQTEALLVELRSADADRLLEPGIGTGRISRPLMERGVRVTGLDIAPRMMSRLREQIGPGFARPDLLLGDATRLPFADESFRAALVVHVLHLVSDWRQTLEEIARVLAPGGVFLHDHTGFSTTRAGYGEHNPWQNLFGKRAELLGALGFVARKRPSSDDIAGVLSDLGASLRVVTYAEEDESEIAADVLARARNKVDSWTWEIPDAIFDEFFTQFEEVVRIELGGLDFRHTTHVQYQLEVWSFP